MTLNDVETISCSCSSAHYKQYGGAVFINDGGSGKFTRVHFKGNTATSVSKLLIFTIRERIEIS